MPLSPPLVLETGSGTKFQLLPLFNIVGPFLGLTRNLGVRHGPSQRYISRTIGGSKYFLSKAITHRIHVGLIGDNVWGRLPQKRCSNIVGEIDHELILNFCDTSTTI